MSENEKNERVDRCLHEAEHAQSGAQMAEQMRDEYHARQLRNKRDNLIREALEVDPKRTAPAWEETWLEILATPTPGASV